jgi:hypothetical protein
MRKIRLNTRIAVRKVNRLDSIDKFGVMFGIFFLLPAVTLLLHVLFVNGARML